MWILLAVVVSACLAWVVFDLAAWVVSHAVGILGACLLVGGAAVLVSGGFITVDLGDMGGRHTLDAGDLPDTGDLDLSGFVP